MRKPTIAALAALAVLAGCGTPAPSPPPTSPPGSGSPIESVGLLAVVGDSVSLAVNACGEPGPCRDSSWAAGVDPAVNSVASRIADATGTAPRVVYAARDGGDVKQAADMVVDGLEDETPDLVTVLIGANDACAVQPSEMTPVAEFRSDLKRMLEAIATRAPEATTLMMSIPNLNQVWDLSRDNTDALAAWDEFWGCRNLLRNPTSTAPEVEKSRSAVAERVSAYNEVIAEECDAVSQCISDGGALHAHEFTAGQVSTTDYFHPSREGQAAIADLAWSALTGAS